MNLTSFTMNTQPIQIRISKVIPLASGLRLNVNKENEETTGKDLSGAREVFAISTKGKIEMIHFSEIKYVNAESNYVRFHMKDEGMIVAAKTLKEVSGVLGKAGFIRVHKSFMLHPSLVKQYDIVRGFLLLRTGEKIPVSRANKKMVSEKLLTCFC